MKQADVCKLVQSQSGELWAVEVRFGEWAVLTWCPSRTIAEECLERHRQRCSWPLRVRRVS